MSKIAYQALTFDDLLLLPSHSDVMPSQVRLTTQLTAEISMNLPLCSAAMDTVTEHRLAIAMAQEGGIGILHKSMSIDAQAQQVQLVKKHESGVVKQPVTATSDTSVQDIINLTKKHGFSGVPIVDNDQLVGIVTSRDVRFETDLSKPVREVMTPQQKLVTVKEGTARAEIISLLHQHRIEKILVVGDRDELKGLVTVKDIQKAKDKPLASKDTLGRLRVGAAVGTADNTMQRVEALVAAGVDVIVVDTSHGHSQKVLNTVKAIKQHFSDHVQVIGGNIATSDAAIALRKAGADAVKVGIGPGSICTTRVVAGVGVPQVSAVMEVAKGLKGSGIPIIADGGIRYSGDVCKALAAGANSIMIGSLLAGTEESPGEIILFQGRSYKAYRGMGSIAAMKKGSSDRYFQGSRSEADLISHGIEGRVPYKGPVSNILSQLAGGVRDGMGYTGCSTIQALHENACFLQISGAGAAESHPHDVTMTKEPPNYQQK